MLSRLFSNYLKIIKIKDRRLCWISYRKFTICLNQTRLIFFHLKIAQLYIIMYFYVIQTVFKLFKNHKNQRSQIVLNFILKILQSAKNQTGSIFFHLKIAQLYIIMYFYIIQTVFKPFKNHKNQRSQIVLNFILKILQSAKNQTGLIFFHLKIAQ